MDVLAPKVVTRKHFFNLLPKQGVVAEIGVQCGNGSASILNTCNPELLYLIDCWEHQRTGYGRDAANVQQNKQDNNFNKVCNKFSEHPNIEIIKAYSLDAVNQFKDQYFDWIYIDANHTYEALYEDLRAWIKKIKIGGFITGHDYVMPHMKTWKRSQSQQHGVYKAINEFVEEFNFKIDFMSDTNWPDWAIQKLR